MGRKSRTESPKISPPRAQAHRAAKTARKPGHRRGTAEKARYANVRKIDGRHPLAASAPSAVIHYPARRRRDSRVAYFNFELAREIGMLPSDHPDRLTSALRNALLETFSLIIVNEWDVAHDQLPSKRDTRPHPYMATRYLQLQHPDKHGQNSGDGRSIWNGILETPAGRFDISSCGTGVTRLCPATSETGQFFQSGNALADYGCGTAHIEEGIGAALMSEAFTRNGLRTERVLAVLALPSGFAINVRVAPNLLRPSHFFGLLRRRQDEDLRQMVLYYANREIQDGRWPDLKSEHARFRHLATQVARDFAHATARFESEYVFCWLDWDGDNILTDASIIDYGSVRQFGLYHHSYRFEDTDRMSTSIPEQKRKARQIVQRFVQIRELLLTGERVSLDSLADDPVLTLFDEEFDAERQRLFARQLGFEGAPLQRLLRARPESLDRLMSLHRRLERKRSSRGPQRVPDGLSWNATYCMRDILRELPEHLRGRLDEKEIRLPAEDFFDIAVSDYASSADRRITPYLKRLAADYQRAYLEVVDAMAEGQRRSRRWMLDQIGPLARDRNPYARMTGDGLTHATRRLTNARCRLTPEEVHRIVQSFADFQQREGETPDRGIEDMRAPVRRIHRDLLALAQQFRESL